MSAEKVSLIRSHVVAFIIIIRTAVDLNVDSLKDVQRLKHYASSVLN